MAWWPHQRYARAVGAAVRVEVETTPQEDARLTRIRASVAASTVPLPLGAIGEGARDGLCPACSAPDQHAVLATHPSAPAGFCLGCGGPLVGFR